MEASLRGEEPAPLDPAERFTAGTYACAERDPHVARVVARVSLLLDLRSTLTTDPLVKQGVDEFLSTAGELSAAPPVMARARFEELVG